MYFGLLIFIQKWSKTTVDIIMNSLFFLCILFRKFYKNKKYWIVLKTYSISYEESIYWLWKLRIAYFGKIYDWCSLSFDDRSVVKIRHFTFTNHFKVQIKGPWKLLRIFKKSRNVQRSRIKNVCRYRTLYNCTNIFKYFWFAMNNVFQWTRAYFFFLF